MTHRKKMMTIDIGQTPEEIVSELMATRHARVPVWKDEPDNIVGVLRTRSLVVISGPGAAPRRGAATLRAGAARTACAPPRAAAGRRCARGSG